MDKKVIAVFVSIIVFLVLFSVSYISLSNNLKKNQIDIEEDDGNDDVLPSSVANSVKFSEIKKSNDKIVESFSITMNGMTKTFEIDYTYKEDGDNAEIVGNFSDLKLYYDSYEKKTETDDDFTKFKDTNYTESYLKNKFTEKNFKFIKGVDDKTYLAILSKSNQSVVGYSNYLFILNDKFEIVKGDTKFNDCAVEETFTMRNSTMGFIVKEEPGKSGYKDNLGVCSKDEGNGECHLYTQIKDDKIYYLIPKNVNILDGNYGTLEERIYTIKDNKLYYTVKASYNITEITGHAC